MASSLAAAIKDRFGITANLKEGHGGIFEVAINAKVVYSNDKVCGRLPKTEEVLQKIGEYEGHLVWPSTHAHRAEQGMPDQSGSPEHAAGGEPADGTRC